MHNYNTYSHYFFDLLIQQMCVKLCLVLGKQYNINGHKNTKGSGTQI